MNVRFYLSYDIKNTLKSHFRRKDVIIFIIMNCCYGLHNFSCKSINIQWFMDFNARGYSTPRREGL